MKHLLTIVAVLSLLIIAPVAHSFSMVAANQPVSNAFFVGGRYVTAETPTHETGGSISIGAGHRLGGSLWLFTYGDMGSYKAASTELAYMFTEPLSALQFGIIAGPNATWAEPEEGTVIELDPVAYVVGATGVVATLRLSGDKGIWGYYKYLLTQEEQTYVNNGSVFGVGLYKGF